MEKPHRNEPCPCGSGIKYKNCCGSGNVISISQILESEIDNLQKQLIYFTFNYFGDDVEEDFEVFQEYMNIEFEDEQTKQFFELIHAIWVSLFVEFEDGTKIIEKFIAVESAKIKQPKLKQILKTWTKARTIAGTVIKIEGNKLTVKDGFSGEHLIAITSEVPIQINKGCFFIAILVPFEQNYVFFPSPIGLPDLTPEHAISFIKESSFASEFDSPQQYLTDYFVEILSELPMVMGLVEIDDLEWAVPIFKEVATLFKTKAETLDLPPSFIDIGILLWYDFCQKKRKYIQNPSLYAASLHYLLSKIIPPEKVLIQKELAQIYSVSPSSVSSISSEMKITLTEEINELVGIVYGNEEGSPIEETKIIEFPNKRNPDG